MLVKVSQPRERFGCVALERFSEFSTTSASSTVANATRSSRTGVNRSQRAVASPALSLQPISARPSLVTSVGGSIATRLALGIVVLVALVTSVVVAELNRLEWQRLLTSKRAAAEMVAVVFAGSLAPALDFKDDDAVRDRVDGLRVSPEILQAQVVASGRSEPVAQYRRPNEPECSDADCIEVLHPVLNPTAIGLSTASRPGVASSRSESFVQMSTTRP